MTTAERVSYFCCCGHDEEYIEAEIRRGNIHASSDRLSTLGLPVSIYLVIGMLWFLAATMIGTTYPGTIGDLSSLADFTIGAVLLSYVLATWHSLAMSKHFINFVHAILTVAILFTIVFIIERSWRYTGCNGTVPIDPTDQYAALLCPNWKILIVVISLASAMTLCTIIILGLMCCWGSYRSKRSKALGEKDKFKNN